MSLNSALFLLICLLTGGALVAAIKIVDLLVRPFRQRLQPHDGPQDHPVAYHLNPVDGTLLAADADGIAPLSDVCEGAAEHAEGATEGLATAIETLSGLMEGIATN